MGQPVIFSIIIFDKKHNHEHVTFVLASSVWGLVLSDEEQCELWKKIQLQKNKPVGYRSDLFNLATVPFQRSKVTALFEREIQPTEKSPQSRIEQTLKLHNIKNMELYSNQDENMEKKVPEDMYL